MHTVQYYNELQHCGTYVVLLCTPVARCRFRQESGNGTEATGISSLKDMKKGVRDKRGRASKKSKETALQPVAKVPKGRDNTVSKGGKAKATGSGHKKAGDGQHNGSASESHGVRKKKPGVLEQVRSSFCYYMSNYGLGTILATILVDRELLSRVD